MSVNGKLIARATVRAYASALAGGADSGTAYEAACALYRYSHPRVRECILRRVVAVLVNHPPPAPRSKDQTATRHALQSTGERDIAAVQRAYIAAISGGAKAHAAFDSAKAAYRALHPGLAGGRLDDAVARALASEMSDAAGGATASSAYTVTGVSPPVGPKLGPPLR
jgi:hypothetical protein